MAFAWDAKSHQVILKFETAALCSAGLESFNRPKRQRPRWTVQALDAVRLTLSYDEPKTRHSFRVTVVEPYLGKDACTILVPDQADAAAGAATGADTGPGAGAAANAAAASVSASGGPRAEVPDSAPASAARRCHDESRGGARLMARALMLLEPGTPKDPTTTEHHVFHERLGGGIAGRVVRVTDGRGCVFAGKCARSAEDSHGLLREAHMVLSAGTHPNLVKLLGVTLCGAGKLCLLFPCASCTFEAYLTVEARSAQPLARASEARDALAALLPAIAHVHARNIIHTDIKAENLLLERWPRGSFGGRRLLLADFSESVLDDPACRRIQPLAGIIKDGSLHTTSAPNRAPELHYGVAAWNKLIDEWSAGTVALQTIRGQPWTLRAEKPDMAKAFGTEAVRRVFGDAPLFASLERSSVQPPGAAPGAELDGDGRRVLQALLEPDPAKRGHADDLVQSNWFRERPVFKPTVVGRGGKGPFVVFEAFLGDDVLAFRGSKSARAVHERAISVSCLLGVRIFSLFKPFRTYADVRGFCNCFPFFIVFFIFTETECLVFR
jgi:hypothetical protein